MPRRSKGSVSLFGESAEWMDSKLQHADQSKKLRGSQALQVNRRGNGIRRLCPYKYGGQEGYVPK